jgi:preprotein translocase subunit YajC
VLGSEVDRARIVPVDKLILAGARLKAGHACVLSGGRFCPQNEQRMNVATSFALFLAGNGAAGGGGLTMLLPLLLIPVLYLMMIRPQQKRQKQWRAMLDAIKTGDHVTTAGGIRGIIMSIKGDSIVIRVAPDNLKLEVAKSAIASVTTQDSSSGS